MVESSLDFFDTFEDSLVTGSLVGFKVEEYRGEDGIHKYTIQNEFCNLEFSYQKKGLIVFIEDLLNNHKYYYHYNGVYSYIEGRGAGLEDMDDFLCKFYAIVNGKPYDSRITIDINLEEDQLQFVTKASKVLGITVEEYLVKILEDAVSSN